MKIFAKAMVIRLKDLIMATRYDVIMIYREALMINTGVVESLLSIRHTPLVFDFDDAIWLQGVSRGNARLAWLRAGPSKIPSILRRMDMVFAGNDYLADYARQFNETVHVVPTTLNTETHAPRAREPNASLCIGWSGSPSTVPYFDTLVPALMRVKQSFRDGVYFRLIGDPTYRRPEIDVVGRPWREDTEVEDANEFDIGVMPLPDDPWTRGKCGFKALLYMSLGVPPVVSPVGVNKTIVTHGLTGYIAQNDDEWFASLSKLILEPDLRREIGRRARATVVGSYSLSSQRERYLGLIDQLASRRK